MPAKAQRHLLAWCGHQAQAGALQRAEGQRRRRDGQIDRPTCDGHPSKQVEDHVRVGCLRPQRHVDTLQGSWQRVLLQHGRYPVSPQCCEQEDQATDEPQAFELADPQPTRQAHHAEGCHYTRDAEAQQGCGACDDDVQHYQPQLDGARWCGLVLSGEQME